MQKKSLLLSLAAFALALTFVGCGESYPDTTTEKAPSLSGPANLAAKAYPGVNLITWDVHKDAADYSVYRKDMVTGDTVNLGKENANTTRHIDAVSSSSSGSLIDKREYTYTVIANSGQSTSARSIGEKDVIFDGASSVKVKANIPEIGTAVAVPAEADITIESKAIDGEDFFVVKWTNTADLFNKYTVSYVYGSSAAEIGELYELTASSTVDDESVVADYLTRDKYVKLPAIGGAALAFRVNGKFYSDGYYSDAHVVKTYTAQALTVLPAVETFTVTRDGSNVKLSWSEVEGATGYAIYKAEVDGTTIVGAWQAVTTVVTTQTDTTFSALEQNVADKSYRYLIIAKGAGSVRSKAPKTAVIEPAVNITAPTFTIDPAWLNDSTNLPTVPAVAISWTTPPPPQQHWRDLCAGASESRKGWRRSGGYRGLHPADAFFGQGFVLS